MKRSENFNKMYGKEETPEEQAVGMVVATVLEVLGLENQIDNIFDIKQRFNIYLNWLNEEVGE